ncbi:hypothetical protein ACVWW2_005180 [Bradyrhizobium sp. LM4.3]
MGDAITRFGLGALGLRGIAAIRIGDALDRLVDVGVGDFGDGLLDLEGLEVGERNRRHHLDRNRVGQIGLAVEQLLDLGLLGRHGDLRLGRKAEAALGEQLRVGVADGLVDGLSHHRAAIDLLEVRDRHLAGTEAIDFDLVLEVDELGTSLGVEIRRGNADLELVLQTFREGFCDLHGVQSSSRSVSARMRRDAVINRSGARQTPQRRWFIGPASGGQTSAREQVA